MGSPGELLDLGRKTPAFSVAQRRVLKIESGGFCRYTDWRIAKNPDSTISVWRE